MDEATVKVTVPSTPITGIKDHNYIQPVPLQSTTATVTSSNLSYLDHNYLQLRSPTIETTSRTTEPTSAEPSSESYIISENDQLKIEIAKLKRKNQELLSSNISLRNTNIRLKRKCTSLSENSGELQKKLNDLLSNCDITNNLAESLKKCASEIPLQLVESAAKRISGKRLKSYPPQLRKFALSLQLCSSKAYRYLDYCIIYMYIYIYYIYTGHSMPKHPKNSQPSHSPILLQY